MEEAASAEPSSDKRNPRYWDLLSLEDKSSYEVMRGALSSPSCKNRRNKSLETFTEIIETIHSYVVRNDNDDWKRALVCGVCWLGKDAVAINTRQLRLLIAKCKSSINGSFQQMGYCTLPAGTESASSLIKYFPFLRDNFSELRQWTVRRRSNQKEDKMEAVFLSPAPDMFPTAPSRIPVIEISDVEIGGFEELKPDLVPVFNDPISFIPLEREKRDIDLDFFAD